MVNLSALPGMSVEEFGQKAEDFCRRANGESSWTFSRSDLGQALRRLDANHRSMIRRLRLTALTGGKSWPPNQPPARPKPSMHMTAKTMVSRLAVGFAH